MRRFGILLLALALLLAGCGNTGDVSSSSSG
ncbi:LPS translocon maturation chaperone LptM, partial [Flintibacter sp.]